MMNLKNIALSSVFAAFVFVDYGCCWCDNGQVELVPELSFMKGSDLSKWTARRWTHVGMDYQKTALLNIMSTQSDNQSIRLVPGIKYYTGSMWAKAAFPQSLTTTSFEIDASVNITGSVMNAFAVILASQASIDPIIDTNVQLNKSYQFDVDRTKFTGVAVFFSPYEKRAFFQYFANTNSPDNFWNVNAVQTLAKSSSVQQADFTSSPLLRIRVTNGTTVTVEMCKFVNGQTCVMLLDSIKLPSASGSDLPTIAANGLALGIGAYCRGCDASLDVSQLALYACNVYTTTATRQLVVQSVKGADDFSATTALNKAVDVASSPMQQVYLSLYPPDSLPAANYTSSQLLQSCQHISPQLPAPPYGSNATLNDNVTWITPVFAVDHLVDFSTIDETITVAALLLLTWEVTSCPLSSQDNNFTDATTPQEIEVSNVDDVWTPRFRYLDSTLTNDVMQGNDQFGHDLVLTAKSNPSQPSNGLLNFYWTMSGKFSSRCELDLSKFPFDKQTCLFTFNLLRPTRMVDFEKPQFLWPENAAKLAGEWHYRDYAILLGGLHYSGKPTAAVYYVVTLARDPTYYITNLVLPSVMLLLLELASFILPPDMPDRPAFSMAVLLAITMAQSDVRNQIPKSSQRILLSDYVSALACLCAACTVYQIVACTVVKNHTTKAKLNNGENNTSSISRRRIQIWRYFDLIAALLALCAFASFNAYAYYIIKP